MRLLPALFLLSLVACERSPTTPANGLLVTAAVTPAVVRAGQSVSVEIVFTNRGTESRDVAPNQGVCGMPFEVLRTDGTDTNLGQFLYCEGALDEGGFSLEPGARYTIIQQWSTQDWPLATGAYILRGAVHGPGVVNVPVNIQVTP